MKLAPLKSVLLAVADLGGVAYERQLAPAQLAALVRFVNEHSRAMWEEYPWPELTRVEERHYRPVWDVAATYAAGDEVWLLVDEAAVYYRSLDDANAGHAPDESPAWWESIYTGTSSVTVADGADPLDAYVSLAGIASEVAGETAPEIGRVFRVWDRDPRTNDFAQELPDFGLTNGRLQLSPCIGLTSVWVEYQIPFIEFDPQPWEESETVLDGMVRYVDGALHDAAEIGDCYRARIPTTGEFPPLSDEWEIVPFPAFLSAIVKYLASADRLRADGKEDTAIARENKAEDALRRALQSINTQQFQSAGWRGPRR